MLIKAELIFQGPCVMGDAMVPPFPCQLHFSHSFLSILLHSLFPITTTLPEALVISFVDGHRSRLDDHSLSCFFPSLTVLRTPSKASRSTQTGTCTSLSSKWAFWGPHWQPNEGQTWLVLSQACWGNFSSFVSQLWSLGFSWFRVFPWPGTIFSTSFCNVYIIKDPVAPFSLCIYILLGSVQMPFCPRTVKVNW